LSGFLAFCVGAGKWGALVLAVCATATKTGDKLNLLLTLPKLAAGQGFAFLPDADA
jgi:hypothetical protein